MRYFLFSFTAIEPNGHRVFGHQGCAANRMPSHIEVTKRVLDKGGFIAGSVTGFTEFKNKEDFEGFRGDAE